MIMVWEEGIIVDPKDPESIEPRGLDWTDYLTELGAGITPVTIVGSSWVVTPTGSVTIDSSSIVIGGLSTQFRMSGGVRGVTYKITNHITCSDGTVDERTFAFKVKDL